MRSHQFDLKIDSLLYLSEKLEVYFNSGWRSGSVQAHAVQPEPGDAARPLLLHGL